MILIIVLVLILIIYSISNVSSKSRDLEEYMYIKKICKNK